MLVYAIHQPGTVCCLVLVRDGQVTRLPVNYAARLHIRGVFLRADRYPRKDCRLKLDHGGEVLEVTVSPGQRRNIREVFVKADWEEFRDYQSKDNPT